MSRSRRLQLFRLISAARYFLIVTPLILLLPFPAHAYDLHNAEVTEKKGIFQIQVSAEFDLPAGYVRQVLTDYTHIYRLSSSIIESHVLDSAANGDIRIRSRLLACASVFCREVERVDTVRTLETGDLQAVIIPELSEFRSGKATWTITGMGDKTRLVYAATLEPDFFIPPVVGIPAIKSSLKNEFINTFGRIERIASINLERDWNEEHSLATAAIGDNGLPCGKKLSAALQ